MTTGSFSFDRYRLDPADRRLWRDGVPVELNARYLDALVLLVRESGALISKDRFLDEVWRGVPVTDEALTQCIRTLRRLLGDDAANPRFIETAPKHGYRFIAPVEQVGDPAAPVARAAPHAWGPVLVLGGAGAAGGGAAGALGGLIYGVVAASQPAPSGMGGLSVLLVLICLSLLVGVIGGAGVGFGIAAGLAKNRSLLWSVAGGAFGGLIVGALGKLLGLDAFTLLLGQSPGDITGAAEGAALGAAVGLGVWFGSRDSAPRLRRSVAAAAASSGAAGLLIALLGGRLMAGSLDLLASQFPDSRLKLDPLGALFGEAGFGTLTLIGTSGLEGALFGGCIAGAMILAQRLLGGDGTAPAPR